MNLKLSALLGVLGSLVLAASASAASGGSCESLRSMAIPNVTIAAVDVVTPPPPSTGRGGAAAAAPAGPALPEYCRVRLLLTPSSDSHINAELWMPTTTWNGRFMAVGNGGFGGSIQGFARDAERAAPGLCDLRQRYGTRQQRGWPQRDVRARPPREDRRLRVPRDARDDRHVEVDHSAVLRPAAAVLVLQRLFDRRTPGRDERAALSRRFRRHHRRSAGQPAHSDAHGGRCPRRRARAAPRGSDFARRPRRW